MTDKAPRAVKTPQQRAQEAVDVLNRRLAKVMKAKADLERQARDLIPELDTVQKRLDYARASPDLAPEHPGEETPDPTTT